MADRCPTCGQAITKAVTVSDKILLAALVYMGPSRSHLPWLYVACGSGGHGVDWDSWYVTGPDDRRGYVKGPFPREQVMRLVRSRELEPFVVAPDGSVQAYVLAKRTPECRACGRPTSKNSTLCRPCYVKAEDRYERASHP